MEIQRRGSGQFCPYPRAFCATLSARRSVAILISVAACVSTNAAGAEIFANLIVKTGAAPGIGNGVEIQSFFAPIMADDGTVGVRATLRNGGVTGSNNIAYFVGMQGDVLPVQRTGQQATNLPDGVNFSAINSPRLISANGFGFAAQLSGPGITLNNNTALYSTQAGVNGPARPVLQRGTQAPGLTNGVNLAFNISQAGLAAFGKGGHVIMQSPLAGTGVNAQNGNAIFTGRPESISALARLGDAAPGFDSGTTYIRFLDNSVIGPQTINLHGQVAFSGATRQGFGESIGAVWRTRLDGTVQLVARDGSSITGRTEGLRLGFLSVGQSLPMINDAGQVAFSSLLTGPETNAQNSSAIIIASPSSPSGDLQLKAAARTDDPAPGTDARFQLFRPFQFRLNGRGELFFDATLRGEGINATNDSGIWMVSGDGSGRLIAREGSVLAENRGTLLEMNQDMSLVTNAQGQACFTALFQDPLGIIKTGLMGYDPVQGLRVLIANGDEVVLSNGERVIAEAVAMLGTNSNMSGGQDGRASPLNDAGTLALRIEGNGFGQAVITLQVPSLGTAGVLGLAGIMMKRRRR